ncbi:MAG TPA: S1/P1 Nuclease, partial [Caulobacteraceae bacterium]|nr:S1/P1 Nuclease [Caulobacteraceae bacterium]
MSNRSGAMRVALAAAAFAGVLGASGAAFGWGATGHRLIGIAAIQGLPDSLPDFVRSPQSAADVGELAREPDRWKDAG